MIDDEQDGNDDDDDGDDEAKTIGTGRERERDTHARTEFPFVSLSSLGSVGPLAAELTR